jgi:guanylate kinase
MIAIRLQNAMIELAAAKDYEYLIINDLVKETADLLASIILAERARAHRFPSGKPIGEIGTI